MKIYKITDGSLSYYGSTVQPLSQRMAEHKYSYVKHFNSTKRGQFSSSLIFEKAAQNNSKVCIELVEVVEGTLEDLLKREQWYIENHTCVNKRRRCLPFNSLAEKNEYRRKKYLENKKNLSPITI